MIVFIGLGTEGSFSQVIVTNKELQNQPFGMAPISTQRDSDSTTTQLPLGKLISSQLHIPRAELSTEITTLWSNTDSRDVMVHPYLLKYDQSMENPSSTV